MAVRTVHQEGPLLFVAHGVPDARESLALGEVGITLHVGDQTLLFRWADLEGVEFRLTGITRAQAPGIVRFAERVLRGLYAALAAVLFVVSLGGLEALAPGRGAPSGLPPV